MGKSESSGRKKSVGYSGGKNGSVLFPLKVGNSSPTPSSVLLIPPKIYMITYKDGIQLYNITTAVQDTQQRYMYL